ncbi:hypothetical protein G6L37_05350 [Agrobacterium rubi]|nr:hypothetical protein [Agrobacterium rubi]NTF24783.1 hypothetical protein [Agrobacterium rubi]
MNKHMIADTEGLIASHACHVNVTYGEDPDGCVLDYGDARDCDHGILPSGRMRRSKKTCPYWRRVSDCNKKGDHKHG